MGLVYEQSSRLMRSIYDWRLHDPAVLDAADRFPTGRDFVAAWPELRDEALHLGRDLSRIPRFHELMAAQRSISAQDRRDWRMFVLKAYGVRVAPNMAQCPRLAALVDAAPDVLSATLSFLAPHKRIPPHRGPFRGVLRFYLGLVVPTAADGRPATVLTLDGVDHRLAAGDSLLWDDTFVHAVHNDSDQPRIALLLDVRRRGMPADLELLTRLVIAGARLALQRHPLARGRAAPR